MGGAHGSRLDRLWEFLGCLLRALRSHGRAVSREWGEGAAMGLDSGLCGNPRTVGDGAEDRKLNKGAGAEDEAYAGAWPVGTQVKK